MKVIVSISDGMAERNLLKTDFLFYLLQKSELEVIFVSASQEYFTYLSERYTSPSVSVVYEPYSINWIDAAFAYIFRNSIHSHTVREEQYSQKNGINGQKKRSFFTYYLFRFFWYLGKYRSSRELLRLLYRLFNNSHYAEKFLKNEKPDLVFIPSINPADYKLLWQAKKQGIFCVQMIKSWDNLTSKTFLATLPDYLITHNEIMKDEAVLLDDMPKERVFVSGIPQFDYLLANKEKFFITREKFYSDLGIEASKKVILFSASGDRISPHDRDYLIMLNDAIIDGRLPSDTHIHVRLHPKYESNLYGVEKLPHVTVERPFSYLTSNYRDWVFEESDIIHWYNSILHSFVVINVASTMALDAAINDRPVISLGFDGFSTLPYNQSILRYYDRDHYRPVMKTNGVSLVKSKEELFAEINHYLKDTNYKKSERAILVSQQCYKLDGRSSKRIVEFLFSFLEEKNDK